MARYVIRVLKRAERELAKLETRDRERLLDAIEQLGEEPFPPGVIQMKGEFAGHYRIRVGQFRVVYTVETAALVIEVVRVGNRREVYRR